MSNKPPKISIPLFKLQRDVLNDYLNNTKDNLDTSVYEVLLGIENLLDRIYDDLIDNGEITLFLDK